MALAGNVAADLEAVGQAHARHLTKSRVRLLRRRGVDAGSDSPLLRAGLQSRHLVATNLRFARLTAQLVDRCPTLSHSPGFRDKHTQSPNIRNCECGSNEARRGGKKE